MVSWQFCDVLFRLENATVPQLLLEKMEVGVQKLAPTLSLGISDEFTEGLGVGICFFFFFLTNDTLDGPDMLGSLNRFHSLYIKCVASDTKKVPINPTLNSSERVDKCHPTPSPSVASLFFHPKQSHLHSEHHTYPTLEHYKSDASKLQRFSHKLCTHRFQLPSGDSKCKHALWFSLNEICLPLKSNYRNMIMKIVKVEVAAYVTIVYNWSLTVSTMVRQTENILNAHKPEWVTTSMLFCKGTLQYQTNAADRIID